MKGPDLSADLLDDAGVREGGHVAGLHAVLEIAASTRRMIFPERVFGISATTQTSFGRAIFPIVDSIAAVTSRSDSRGVGLPGL